MGKFLFERNKGVDWDKGPQLETDSALLCIIRNL